MRPEKIRDVDPNAEFRARRIGDRLDVATNVHPGREEIRQQDKPSRTGIARVAQGRGDRRVRHFEKSRENGHAEIRLQRARQRE
jgi:hypothetical protein